MERELDAQGHAAYDVSTLGCLEETAWRVLECMLTLPGIAVRMGVLCESVIFRQKETMAITMMESLRVGRRRTWGVSQQRSEEIRSPCDHVSWTDVWNRHDC